MKYRRFFTLLVILAALCGCAHYEKPHPAAEFPSHAIMYDLHFAWETIPAADSVTVRGELKNARYDMMDNVELDLSLLDQTGNELEKQVFFPVPGQMIKDDYRSFLITFHHASPPGGTIQFLYRYRGIEAGGQGTAWMNSFQANAATGAVLRKPNEEPPTKF